MNIISATAEQKLKIEKRKIVLNSFTIKINRLSGRDMAKLNQAKEHVRLDNSNNIF